MYKFFALYFFSIIFTSTCILMKNGNKQNKLFCLICKNIFFICSLNINKIIKYLNNYI